VTTADVDARWNAVVVDGSVQEASRSRGEFLLELVERGEKRVRGSG
jgi:hypothetical protein